MTQQYDNTNRGALFVNNNKRDGQINPRTGQPYKDADYNGSININGVEHFLDAWLTTSRDGTKQFLSVKIGGVKQTQPSNNAQQGQFGQPAGFGAAPQPAGFGAPHGQPHAYTNAGQGAPLPQAQAGGFQQPQQPQQAGGYPNQGAPGFRQPG